MNLAVQLVAEDFFLPSPTGSGVPLSRRELEEKLEQLHPSVFFSHELCARYFTYMSRESGAHFVLFDDRDTLRKKLDTQQPARTFFKKEEPREANAPVPVNTEMPLE